MGDMKTRPTLNCRARGRPHALGWRAGQAEHQAWSTGQGRWFRV